MTIHDLIGIGLVALFAGFFILLLVTTGLALRLIFDKDRSKDWEEILGKKDR